MRKNVAGQHIGFVLVVASTGAALVGASPSGYLSKDGGAQAALSGSFTGLGNGQYDYAPTQAETNADELGILFTAATAIPVGLTIYTTAANPADAAALGLTNLDAVLSTRAVESTVAKDATVAKDGTVAKDATVAKDSTVAKDATVAKEGTLVTVGSYVDTEILDILNRLPAALVGGRMESYVGAKGVLNDLAAADLLLTPANKLATDGSGRVTVGSNADKSGYSLSVAGVSALWAEVLEGTLSAAAFLRIILAFAAGISTDDGKEFYDLAGTKKRIDGTMVGKDRTAAVLDGTP